jgi:hypothetical protein
VGNYKFPLLYTPIYPGYSSYYKASPTRYYYLLQHPLTCNGGVIFSTSFGIGIIIGSYWAVWKWAPSFKVGPQQDFNLGWAEAVAVELGLYLALSLGIVGNGKLGGHTLLVWSDNAGIIAVTNKGWSCSCKTNRIFKHVYALQAQNHLHSKATHVVSCFNISDALS